MFRPAQFVFERSGKRQIDERDENQVRASALVTSGLRGLTAAVSGSPSLMVIGISCHLVLDSFPYAGFAN